MANRHERVTDLLSSSIDHKLTPEEQTRLEAHLVACAECRGELRQLQQLVAILRSCPQVKPPRSFALGSDTVRPQGLVLRFARFAPAMTALAAVLLAALLFAEGQMFPSRAPLAVPLPSLGESATGSPAFAAATLAAAATAPAGLAKSPAPPTIAAAEPPAAAEARDRALSVPAVEASAAGAVAAAGGKVPTLASQEALAESKLAQPTAPLEKAREVHDGEPSLAVAATPAAGPAAARAQEEGLAAEGSPAGSGAEPPPVPPLPIPAPLAAREAPGVRLWPLRVAEVILAVILASSLALWLNRLMHPTR